jgi:hypothetical protein
MSDALRKHYEPPTLEKLTAEQAELLLLDAARKGDQNARAMLELIQPKPSVKN